MRIFLAGATGVIGRHLVPRLLAAGHDVTGLTRSGERIGWLRGLGAHPVVADALDRVALTRAVETAQPEVVIHELTALPRRFVSTRDMSALLAPTDRLRTVGTRNLLDAALAAGTGRFIAQSVAFFYAADRRAGGGALRTEDDPLDDSGAVPRGAVAAIRELERLTTSTPGVEGTVLRYGVFYGPGTYYAADGEYADLVRRGQLPLFGDGRGVASFVALDDAADATLNAVEAEATGIFNVVDDEPAPASEWLPLFAELLGAPRPRRIPAWLGRVVAGRFVVYLATAAPGASNGRARQELGWAPRTASWREGLRELLRQA